MAWSEQTFYTLYKRGIRNKDGNWIRADLYTLLSYPPSQYKDFTISCTPIMALGEYQDVYTNAFNQVIFEPYEVISDVPGPLDNVAKVKFVNSFSDKKCPRLQIGGKNYTFRSVKLFARAIM